MKKYQLFSDNTLMGFSIFLSIGFHSLTSYYYYLFLESFFLAFSRASDKSYLKPSFLIADSLFFTDLITWGENNVKLIH